MPQFRKELTDHLRPILGGRIDQGVVSWLDGWMDRAGVPRDGADAGDVSAAVAAGINAGASAALSGSAEAAALSPAPPADDRFLPVFQRLASPQADAATVQAMARSFAQHAPAFGQAASTARIAEFVAQIANETGGFTKFHENLRYSARRIPEVWPSRIAAEARARGLTVAALAASLANNPEGLANVVYQRANEGNTQPGDGWRYRGRGALQLTFRNNYRHFGQLLGIDLEGNPDLAADPAVSVLIALQFFKAGRVNAAIDAGNFREARRITNGGALGLDEVARLRARALQVLG